jgi:surfactin family lipopeptide synthetase A
VRDWVDAGDWTPVEELVAGIWSEVLQVEGVGRGESFFELGGHSLLATQVISRVREVFAVEVGLRRLFEEPTVRGLSRSIEEQLRAGAGVTVAALQPAGRAQWGGLLPLSFAQQRLWFLDKLQPDSATYNIPAAVRLKGELQVAALERTLSEVVRRHEVLRTRFVNLDGKPQQEVLPAENVKLTVLNFSELEETDREAAVRKAATAESQELFDLAQGPLLRVKLLRLGNEEHAVLLTMHHIVSDGWSMGVLIKEVATLYEAYSQGEESPLTELPVQYGDFAVWQRGWLQGEELERQLGYWREQLGGTLPVLELPTFRARPAVQSHRGSQLGLRLSPEVSAGLKELSRREGVTLFMTLLAAFQTLLYRYSGQQEIVVGTPVAGRNYRDTEGLIGFFVNTLALRTDLRGEPTFVELLQRVKEVCLGAYAHQDLPFEKLMEELQPERDLSRAPLFQTMFVLQNAPQQDLRLAGLKLSRVGAENATAKFDLTLVLQEKDEELSGSLQYQSDLFERTRIERMLRHFEVLLQGIVRQPEQPLWELPLLQEEELDQAITSWNETRRDYGPSTMVHELFEAQAQQQPEAMALVCGLEQLSYGELNRRANQLAHYLRKQGVGAEVVVGLCMERSVEMLVGLLGILKAGGAYLPLDPDYPQQRLNYMLSDAQVKLVLTQGRLRDQLPSHQGLTMVVDDEWETIARESEENPEPVSEAGNLVYVIYTSGSTGQPKGVMVTHSGLRNLAAAQVESFGINGSSRVLQFASLNFDASIFEMCMALCNGGELHLASSEQVLIGPALSELLQQEEITVATLPPTVLKQLTDGEGLRKLETLIVAGEACGEELVEQWSEGRRFYNAYGPTETTVWATVEKCQRGGGRPAIGGAIGDVEVYILDKWLKVAPVGVSGEIYIGGAGLARGYHGRADLTAERFVPHPYSTRGGERLYRTGDEGRYLEDGRIDYLGRRDQQVKLRGYRIELGEIEAVLKSHGRVRQAVVTVREEQQLVGYVVGELDEQAAAPELREFLRERLPEYMVPQRWVVLDHLPLTANGKIDRANLPVTDQKPAPHGRSASAGNGLERKLLKIWKTCLKIDKVSVSDNFFDLGGHSLLLVELHARLEEELNRKLKLLDLFKYPTIRTFAEFLKVDGEHAKPNPKKTSRRPRRKQTRKRPQELRQTPQIVPQQEVTSDF